MDNTDKQLRFDIRELERLEDKFILTHNYTEQKDIVDKVYDLIKGLLESGMFYNIPKDKDLFGLNSERQGANGGNKGREQDAENMNKELEEKSETANKQMKKEVSAETKKKEESQSENSTSTDSHLKRTNIRNEMTKEIEEIQNKISEQVESEIQQDIADIQSIKSVGNENVDVIGEPLQITNEDRLAINKIKNLIRRLRCDLGQHYVRKQKSGLVNMRDYLQTKDKIIPDLNVFNKFKHSKLNKTKLGVVILLDSSGSMSDNEYKLALRSAYCVANSLEATNSKVEVIAFSHEKYDVVKPFNKSSNAIKWNRTMYGGTQPLQSLMFSESELKKIKKQENIENLMFILISDLFFEADFDYGVNSAHKVLQRISKNNTLVTFQVGVTAKLYWNQSDSDSCEIFQKVKSLSDYFYNIITFQELYVKMSDFIRKFETQLHTNIVRGRL